MFLHSDNNDALSKKWEQDKNFEKATIALVRSNQKLGCISQDVELPRQTVGPANVRRSIPKKSGKRSPKVHLELKYTKTAERFIDIREQLGPSLAVIVGGAKHHRNHNAPTFADRDPEIQTTLWAEDGARKAAMQWGNNLYSIRGTYLENEATFFKPKMGWRAASTSTVNPDESEYNVYSGASMHMDEQGGICHQMKWRRSKCLDF